MDLRGPTLLIFGATLVMAPVALRLIGPLAGGEGAPSAIVTQGAAAAACDARSLTLIGGQRIGCNRQGAQREAGRAMPGGASFVSVRD